MKLDALSDEQFLTLAHEAALVAERGASGDWRDAFAALRVEAWTRVNRLRRLPASPVTFVITEWELVIGPVAGSSIRVPRPSRQSGAELAHAVLLAYVEHGSTFTPHSALGGRSANAARNLIAGFRDWVERLGAHALAQELLACRVTRDGIAYQPTDRTLRLRDIA